MADISALSTGTVNKLNRDTPAAYEAQLGTLLQALIGRTPQSGTAVNAVAATGKVTIAAGDAADGNTIKIGGITYTFKTVLSDPVVANEVLIAGTATGTATNLVLAILAAGTVGEIGVKYSTGTVPHPLVAATSDAGVVTVTAATKGAAGNSITLVKVGDNITVTGDTLGTGAGAAAGVDGTIGGQWDLKFDASYMYVAVADNTVSGAYWRRISLGSVY